MSDKRSIHPSNSRTQQHAERLMIAWLADHLEISLEPQRLDLANGSWVLVDGVSHAPPVLVEAWAHQGKAKGAQPNKVAADALKLSVARGALNGNPRLILLFADEDAAAEFRGTSWRASAIADLGIEIMVADIPEDVRSQILKAQADQYR